MTLPVAARFAGGLSWLRAPGRMRAFIETPESEIFLHHPHADGTSDLRPVRDGEKLSRLARGEMLARVDKRVFATELVFSRLESEDGQPFDLALSLVWRIADSRRFLRQYGISLLKSQDAINPVSIENLLIGRCKAPVADEMGTVTYGDLKNREALPVDWWASQLPQWVGFVWLELVEVRQARYESPTADRLLELQAHERLMEIERQDGARQKALELEDRQREAALDDSLHEIELIKQLSGLERQNRAEMIRLEHDGTLLKMQDETGLQKLEAEKERAKLEAEIANIRNHGDAVDERLRQAEASEEEARNILSLVRKARDEIAAATSMMQAAAAQGVLSGKRLSEHAVNISPETLALTGRAQNVQYLTAMARAKANAAPGAVMLKKVDLKSRDIGTRRVKSLAIGSSLEFELAASRSGHVSVLNIGTSGAVYLLAPNGIVSPADAWVRAGNRMIFPGAPLLPGEQLYENGPPGWEELIVVVSEAPLFSHTDLADGDAGAPEVKLSDERIGRLVEQLTELAGESWNAGLLGFMVEG